MKNKYRRNLEDIRVDDLQLENKRRIKELWE